MAARPQSVAEAYAEPTNFLEIDVSDAQTHGFGKVFVCICGVSNAARYV